MPLRHIVAIAALAIAVGLPAMGWAQDAASGEKDLEVQRTEALIKEGALPAHALAQIESDIEAKRLKDRLSELLRRKELTPQELPELLATAARVRDQAQAALRRQQSLVDAGAAPVNSLSEVKSEADFAAKQYELADSRSRLVRELATMARAENYVDELEDEDLAFASEGDASQWDSDIAEIDAIYFNEFGQHLPISAAGDTDLHRSMGFDHTGRYDVALNPDDLEGFFLTTLLDSWGIPYIAFRSAVPGQATGPHVHIGRPSLHIEPEPRR